MGIVIFDTLMFLAVLAYALYWKGKYNEQKGTSTEDVEKLFDDIFAGVVRNLLKSKAELDFINSLSGDISDSALEDYLSAIDLKRVGTIPYSEMTDIVKVLDRLLPGVEQTNETIADLLFVDVSYVKQWKEHTSGYNNN